jgi:hypothetical protein
MRKLDTNEGHSYTPTEIEEVRKCKDDIIYFCENYVYLNHPIRGAIPFKPYAYQTKTLRNYVSNKLNIGLTTRKTGASNVLMAHALWYSIFHSNKIVILAAPKRTQAQDILNNLRYAYEKLPVWMRPNPVYGDWNKTRCGFDNKSRVIASHIWESMTCGMSVDLLCVDELSYVKKNIQEDWWHNILPHISEHVGGRCNIVSGVNVGNDKFTSLWGDACMNSSNGFNAHFWNWDAVPTRDEQFKSDTIKLLGEDMWRHQYEPISNG